MKEKKIGPRVIFVSFIFIICLSRIIWCVLSSFVEFDNNENRTLSSRPKFSIENPLDFLGKYNKFLNDSIPFRNNLIEIDASLNYYLLGVSTNEEVLLGKDGWLFFDKEEDGNPIGCYKGENLFTEEEMENMAATCIRMRDEFKKNDTEFVLLIIPNKERVMSEKMPDEYGSPAEVYAAMQFVQYMKENTDIRVVYPYEELLQAKEMQEVYYKTDTHWNKCGSYVGVKALFDELNISIPSIDDSSVNIAFEQYFEGDLAKMIGIGRMLGREDREYSLQFDGKEEILKGGITVIGDSFSDNMLEYLYLGFNDVRSVRGMAHDHGEVLEKQTDVVVYETVERYLYRLNGFNF